jgi:MFS family permease
MIAGMLGFGLGFGIFDANNMPILSRLAPDKYRATGYGVMNLVSIGVGAGTTVALGAMRDGGVSLAWAFILSALVAAVSIAVVLCIRFPSEERSGQ